MLLQETATKVRCVRCQSIIAILTPDVLRISHKGLTVSVYPGSAATIECGCGERRDFALPLRV